MNENGRVNLNIQNPTNDIFKLYDKIKVKDQNNSSYYNALTGNLENTELSKTFFCFKNINFLNTSLQNAILKKSNGKYNIGPQDNDQLKIIMRSVYLQNSVNQNENIQQQVNILNNIVLGICIPQVFGEIQSYLKYKEDISNLAIPNDRPVMTSTSKNLQLKHFF